MSLSGPSVRLCRPSTRNENYLSLSMALLKLAICVLDLVEWVDVGNRDFKLAFTDQVCQLGKHVGRSCSGTSFRSDTVFAASGEVDDRVDPGSLYTQLKCQLDVAIAKSVDESVDGTTRGFANALRNSFAISNRNYSVISEPGCVVLAGKTNHLGTDAFGKLNRN